MFIATAPATRLSTFGPMRPWIYAVRLVNSGEIKIGFSTDVIHRLSDIKTKHKTDVEILGLMAGTFQIEQALHKSLGASRVNRAGNFEVYHHTTEIAALIQRRMRPPLAIYDETFPVHATYHPRGKGRVNPLTPSGVERACYAILTHKQPSWCKSSHKLKGRLFGCIKREAAAGRDVSQFRAIIRARLGLEVTV